MSDAGGRGRVRVAVLGGGFGGLYAASYLAAADLPDDRLDVTLVADRNYFTFTPLLAEVVAGSLGPEHVTFPYRVLSRRRGFRFRLARVTGVDPDRGVAETTSGEIPFDYAVLALGARPRFFGDADLAAKSSPFATVADAVALRHRVLLKAELADAIRDRAERRRKLTFVVAGAGPAGVEVAGEIWHLMDSVLPGYYDLGTGPRVVLVDASERILKGWDEVLSEEGTDELRRRGVEVRLRTTVRGFDGRVVTLDGPEGGSSVDAETLIWTAGIAPRPIPAGPNVPRAASGHLQVDPLLRLDGSEHTFAVGDAVRLDDPRTGRPYPSAAPIAISQGIRAAANIENSVAGRELHKYRAHHAGKIVSLGGGVALAEVLGFRFGGRAAWALYRATYLLKLVGLKNKFRAAFTLLLNRGFERNLTLISEAGDLTDESR